MTADRPARIRGHAVDHGTGRRATADLHARGGDQPARDACSRRIRSPLPARPAPRRSTTSGRTRGSSDSPRSAAHSASPLPSSSSTPATARAWRRPWPATSSAPRTGVRTPPMNDFFTRVDGALRSAVQRVQVWFDPPLDGEAKPLEIREAIIEDIEQRVESAGAGRRVLPYNRVTVTVLAADKPSRARLQAALAGLQESVAARLSEIRCAIPAGFAVETRYVTRPPAAWAPDQRLAFDYRRARGARRLQRPRPRSRRACGSRSRAARRRMPSYTFAESHVRIGRSAQPIDGRGRPRTNHVVFLEDGDDHSRTVGRAHASIRYDSARREYRVFDDGSHNGTRVMRDGALVRGQAARSGRCHACDRVTRSRWAPRRCACRLSFANDIRPLLESLRPAVSYCGCEPALAPGALPRRTRCHWPAAIGPGGGRGSRGCEHRLVSQRPEQ